MPKFANMKSLFLIVNWMPCYQYGLTFFKWRQKTSYSWPFVANHCSKYKISIYNLIVPGFELIWFSFLAILVQQNYHSRSSRPSQFVTRGWKYWGYAQIVSRAIANTMGQSPIREGKDKILWKTKFKIKFELFCQLPRLFLK